MADHLTTSTLIAWIVLTATIFFPIHIYASNAIVRAWRDAPNNGKSGLHKPETIPMIIQLAAAVNTIIVLPSYFLLSGIYQIAHWTIFDNLMFFLDSVVVHGIILSTSLTYHRLAYLRAYFTKDWLACLVPGSFDSNWFLKTRSTLGSYGWMLKAYSMFAGIFWICYITIITVIPGAHHEGISHAFVFPFLLGSLFFLFTDTNPIYDRFGYRKQCILLNLISLFTILMNALFSGDAFSARTCFRFSKRTDDCVIEEFVYVSVMQANFTILSAVYSRFPPRVVLELVSPPTNVVAPERRPDPDTPKKWMRSLSDPFTFEVFMKYMCDAKKEDLMLFIVEVFQFKSLCADNYVLGSSDNVDETFYGFMLPSTVPYSHIFHNEGMNEIYCENQRDVLNFAMAIFNKYLTVGATMELQVPEKHKVYIRKMFSHITEEHQSILAMKRFQSSQKSGPLVRFFATNPKKTVTRLLRKFSIIKRQMLIQKYGSGSDLAIIFENTGSVFDHTMEFVLDAVEEYYFTFIRDINRGEYVAEFFDGLFSTSEPISHASVALDE